VTTGGSAGGGAAQDVVLTWRGTFSSEEANALHATAFGTRVHSTQEWDWAALCARHSLGWVTARAASPERAGDAPAVLVGFVNVVWDGLVHAWLQDVMVARGALHQGIGTRLVAAATDGARAAGCEWLHVDFDDDLAPFYLDACGFTPTRAGLRRL
jgi:GNAT superfamily N-acetyltransferase